MRTWEDYEKHVRAVSPDAAEMMDEMAYAAEIIGAIVTKRVELGITQRDLAEKTGLSQSTIARIESFKITPNLSTVTTLLKNLGLQIMVVNQ